MVGADARPSTSPAAIDLGTAPPPRDILSYHILEALPMTDLLVRDVPDHVLAAIDARAKSLGVSRTEYVRRQLAQAATASAGAVSPEDLHRFADIFADLDDPAVMVKAWR
jgi:hypothetical protein